MILTENLRKSFATVRAVDGVSFVVKPGEIYGLLGPNGAGKTTTISCISGLLRPDSGRIEIAGIDAVASPIRARRNPRRGPAGDCDLRHPQRARERRLFRLAPRALRGGARQRTDEAARRGLVWTWDRNRPARKFSGGMKRRLNLSAGLIHRPKVILLDEPTLGIDPQARINILDIIRDGVSEGMTAIYTTHYLEEAEKLCDRIAIIDRGRVLAEGTLLELRRQVGEGMIVTLRGRFGAAALENAIAGDAAVHMVSLEDGAAMFSVRQEQRPASDVLSAILRSGCEVTDITMQEPSLQSLFIKLTGRALRD